MLGVPSMLMSFAGFDAERRAQSQFLGRRNWADGQRPGFRREEMEHNLVHRACEQVVPDLLNGGFNSFQEFPCRSLTLVVIMW